MEMRPGPQTCASEKSCLQVQLEAARSGQGSASGSQARGFRLFRRGLPSFAMPRLPFA